MNEMLKRIFELIEQNGEKPTPLSTQLGFSTSAFSDWKKGKASPSLKNVMLLADHFNVSLDYIVFGKEKPGPVRIQYVCSQNEEDAALLKAFHKLSPELRMKAAGYIDGLAAASPAAAPAEGTTTLSV